MGRDRADAELVLVVGDANPDLILTGDVVPRFGQAEQLLDGATMTIGGSAAITAHALARLGRPVMLSAVLGSDRFGERMREDLAAAGVAVDEVVRRDDVPTGLTVVLARAHDRAILTFPGAIPTLAAADVARAVAAARRAGLRHVHVSSLFLQPVLARDLPDLLADLRRGEVTTSLDTNDDPSAGWQGVEALLPHLDVLLPNRAEVTAIARQSDPRRAAGALAAFGPLVVVKDGPNGAFIATPAGELLDQPGRSCNAVDTTGAGDTFDAAFLDAWLGGHALADCLHTATLAGAFAVTAVGGVAGQPTRTDLATAERTNEQI